MLSDDFNPYAAPQADLRAREALGTEIWRDGGLLVVTRASRFPDRCIHCNQHTSLRCGWTLTWYEPTAFLLSVSRSALLQIPLCGRHRRHRRWRMTIGWLLYFGAFASVILASLHPALPVLIFPTFIVVGLIVLRRGLNIASVHHAREGVVWLSGMSRAFLDELPEQEG
jgi:hypothetical protein